MNRTECLNQALTCIMGQREDDYGTPEDNFAVIAKLWSAYLGVEIQPHDVSSMMILLKVGRIASSKDKKPTDDCWVDIAGYAGCGAELIESESYPEPCELKNDIPDLATFLKTEMKESVSDETTTDKHRYSEELIYGLNEQLTNKESKVSIYHG